MAKTMPPGVGASLGARVIAPLGSVAAETEVGGGLCESPEQADASRATTRITRKARRAIVPR
jgi:hypothetical protein